jgi:hypothetical protein
MIGAVAPEIATKTSHARTRVNRDVPSCVQNVEKDDIVTTSRLAAEYGNGRSLQRRTS